MAVHLMDTTLFNDSVGTATMRRIFNERAMLQNWMDVEVALARAQAAMGMIPAQAAEQISAKADIGSIDMEAVKAHGKRTGHSLWGLLSEFRQLLDDRHARYLHFGPTTQDIIDTGLMLMVKNAYGLVMERMVVIMQRTCRLIEENTDTIMVGRTHGNHGLPITFGFKAAIWLSELSRQLERWTEAKKRILVGNLTGAVGTFASWGEKGPELQKRSLDLLGLGEPETVWHSSRDRMAEVANLCALLAGTAGRIAREIYNLSKTEFSELQEPSDGKIGSSTMPHKKNPIHSEWIMVLERGIRANASTCIEVMGQENERDASRWKNEWITIPESFVFLSGILNHLEILMKGLRVNKQKMLENTQILKGMLLSEKVMFLLEKYFALPEAHDKVYQASVRASEKQTLLIDELMADEDVAHKTTRKEIQQTLDPSGYIGLAPQVAHSVVARVQNQLNDLNQHGSTA